MLVPKPRRILPGREIVHSLIRKPRDVRIEHPDVDLLTLAGPLPMTQRREHADAAVKPGEKICDRYPDLLRRAIRFPGQAHDAAHRLHEAIVARTWGIRAGLTEAGNRAVDQARKSFPKLLIAEPIFGECADLEVFRKDVALCDQLKRDRLTLGLRDVQRDRALVAVDANEIRALIRAGHEGRRESARIVA